jgi:hypothetical protein
METDAAILATMHMGNGALNCVVRRRRCNIF